MQILRQIGLLLGICLLGEAVAAALPFPFPASVIAMAMLFILLCTRVVKPAQMQQTGDFLLQNMAFFFIPAGVGILEHFDELKGSLLAFLAICLLTTVITFFAAAMTVRAVMALQSRGKGGRS